MATLCDMCFSLLSETVNNIGPLFFWQLSFVISHHQLCMLTVGWVDQVNPIMSRQEVATSGCFVCTYICMCVCVYVCMYVCTNVHMHIFTLYICMYIFYSISSLIKYVFMYSTSSTNWISKVSIIVVYDCMRSDSPHICLLQRYVVKQVSAGKVRQNCFITSLKDFVWNKVLVSILQV